MLPRSGAEPETARRLPAIVRKGDLIALGTATDPYQPAEAEARVTRRFLETVAALRHVRLGITTKGALVLRDIDLLQRIHQRSSLSINVSLISLDAEPLRRLEPLAPASTRIQVVTDPAVFSDMLREGRPQVAIVAKPPACDEDVELVASRPLTEP